MFARLGEFVARHWRLVILFWIAVVVLVRLAAPRWDDVTYDGDLAYLPENMPSVVGQRLTEAAFPHHLAKSQIVLIVAREDKPLQSNDLQVSDLLARRFHNLLGAGRATRGLRMLEDAERLRGGGDHEGADALERGGQAALETALTALDEALRLDEGFAQARLNRGLVRAALGHLELADQDRQQARRQLPELRDRKEPWPTDAEALPLVDVWTRHTEVVGSKLRSEDRQAALVILQLSNEFMATDNMGVMDRVESEMETVRRLVAQEGPTGLILGISGSAAVGGDMLRSAAESIKNTELFTVGLVITILLVVYRAPLLITVPLVTIFVSLVVSTGLLALMAHAGAVSGIAWWTFKIFKTTKIFIVVILFGAGTDFCLFLIARYREELGRGQSEAAALVSALAGVGNALCGSALTTILGLAMMFFADFGKFRYSGPAIGLCLAVTLFACLTLAPAMLRAYGMGVFWPFGDRDTGGGSVSDRGQTLARSGLFTSIWRRLARFIVLYPGSILVISLLLLAPLATAGLFTADHVTFDLLSALDPDRPSRQGTELLKHHFPVGEGGPVIVLAVKSGAGFGQEERRAETWAAIANLTGALCELQGVSSVRSLYEPLGDPPGPTSIFRSADRRKLVLREHRLTRSLFLAQAEGYEGNVTRFEVVLDDDPFSPGAVQTFARIDECLQTRARKIDAFWTGAQFVYTGTTAGIRDLRSVTRSDNRRIQILVVIAVFAVLWFILRKPTICLYLILSVLFSYLVTIGATELFFQTIYGASFQGLDWKVPIFLFVILVAVGEDYNIYFVTRVFEEQAVRGPFAGLREAIVRTGGIITSCGIIMAGTFVSMTTGTLRGIVELGFALSLGVLLDTFVVRTLLVPAFLAVLCRWQAARSAVGVSTSRGAQDD